MNPKSPFIGIDFGTSNSKMAWYNPKTNQAEILRNAEGEEQTPSVVYFGENQTLVGSPAEEMLEYEQERDRIIISIKRELITTPLLALPGKAVRAVEVAAEILRKLRCDAEDYHFRQEVTHAVITYPASFGLIEQDRIRAAAQLAGFTEVKLLEEPVAAAIAYAQMGLQVGKYVLVYDLGGGTFDLAVLVREDDGIFRLALEPQGIKRCGGDDFDEALYNYCDRIARTQLGRPISLADKRNLHFLNQCRQRKENLSNVERRLFRSLLEPGAVIFQLSIERATFEGLIRATVEETVRKTKVILEQASVEGYSVDTLVLIGGSSRVPLVKNMLKEQLALLVSLWQNQDVAVALGAAYAGHRQWGRIVADVPVAQKPEESESKSPEPGAGLSKELRARATDALAQGRELYERTKDELTQSYTKAKEGQKLEGKIEPTPEAIVKTTDSGKVSNTTAILEVLHTFQQQNQARLALNTFYVSPIIPKDKLANARDKCNVPNSEEILGLIDISSFGSAKDCILFGTEGISYHNRYHSPGKIPYSELSAFPILKSNWYQVAAGNGKKLSAGPDRASKELLYDILNAIKRLF